MPFHLEPRREALHVTLAGWGHDADWSALCAELPSLARGRSRATLDVSDLTLLPTEVVRLGRLLAVAHAAGVEVEVACSRLSGRRVLQRILPPGVAVVLPPEDDATSSDEAASASVPA